MGTGPRVAGLGTGGDSTGITGGAFATYVLCTSRKPILIQAGEGRGQGHFGKFRRQI